MVLSATSMVCRTFLRFGTKSVHVEGLPRMLEALREGNMEVLDKGKRKATETGDQSQISGEPTRRRRGIVTSECNV